MNSLIVPGSSTWDSDDILYNPSENVNNNHDKYTDTGLAQTQRVRSSTNNTTSNRDNTSSSSANHNNNHGTNASVAQTQSLRSATKNSSPGPTSSHCGNNKNVTSNSSVNSPMLARSELMSLDSSSFESDISYTYTKEQPEIIYMYKFIQF